jgi:hypothetical protein
VFRRVLEREVGPGLQRGEPFTIDEGINLGDIPVRSWPSSTSVSGPLYGPIAAAFIDVESSIATAVECKNGSSVWSRGLASWR